MSRVQATVNSVLNNRHTLFRWFGKGFWAIMDQGLFAVSNFVLNVMLARWLTPADYGAFAVAYTIFLLLGTFHTALITEPMLVFGSGKYKDRFTSYLNVLLRGHWAFTAIIGVLFTLTGLGFWYFDSPLTPVIFALAITSPFILFQWLMRKACYVNLQPQLAAQAGALYMVLMFVGAYAIYHYGWLSSTAALIVMTVASLFSALWLFYRLNVRMKGEAENGLAKGSLKDHWKYGKWAIGVSAVSWVRSNIYILLLPIWSGLDEVGALRALMNVNLPISQFTTAISIAILPALSAARGTEKFQHIFKFSLTLFVACAVAYWILLSLFGFQIMNLLYSGQYNKHASLLLIIGVLPLLNSIITLIARSLQAIELPRKVFTADWLSTLISLPVGITLLIIKDISGTVIALCLASVVTLILMERLLRRHGKLLS